jgi:hypothetical protein
MIEMEAIDILPATSIMTLAHDLPRPNVPEILEFPSL